MTHTPRFIIVLAFGVLLLVFAAVFTNQVKATDDETPVGCVTVAIEWDELGPTLVEILEADDGVRTDIVGNYLWVQYLSDGSSDSLNNVESFLIPDGVETLSECTKMVYVGVAALAGEETLNQVDDWCNGNDGVKYEPVTTPFIVPAPPAGTTWTLLVLKAGTTNETVANPIVGQSYSHSEHDNSHVILCWEELSDTTTTSTVPDTTTTTTTSIPTTTVPKTTTTTEPSTTTTDPTTTSSSTTTTDPNGTTTSSSTTTTSTTPSTSLSTTTTKPTTTIPPELPLTGSDVMPYAIVGMVLLLTGGLIVNRLRANG